jgi:(R,R)-butanediol dehydrogenase/meso-butanediol dehydrogenase/diacetyl reductase
MRAVRFHGREDVRLDDIATPEPGVGQIALRTAYCGLCGSDLHEVRSGPHAIPRPDRPHPLTGVSLPLVLGHEFAGVVTALGEGVSGVAIGDRVVVEPLLRDGTCPQCQAGFPNRCRQIAFIGLSGPGGGLAETTVVPADAVHRLPPTVALDAGALVEPCAVAWHAIEQAGFRTGDDVLVLGAGPVGLATVVSLRYLGAGRIAVSEPSERRRRAAAALGADVVLDPTTADVGTAVRGVRSAIDCAGHPDGVAAGVRALAPGGTLVLVALPHRAVLLELQRLVHLEVAVTGSIAYRDTFPRVMEALSNGFDPVPLVSRRAPLRDIPELLRLAARGEIDELKILAEIGS